MKRDLSGCELVLTYYGDDFTGSTDVMDSLTTNGLPTVLFLEPPSRGELERFPGYRAVGVAGTSRSQPPAWMERTLPAIFQSLKNLGAPVCHYKTCSTFDSSQQTGSIGKALDLGQEIFRNRYVPLVVGAPALRRYTVFGNLFATAGGVTHRLDRHPTMSCHPITPMRESDLRRHLGEQTAKNIELMDILALQSPDVDRRFDEVLARQPEVVLFDTLDQASLIQAGRLLWERRDSDQAFMVGSSGLEYALVAYWQSAGQLPETPAVDKSGPVDRIAVVSGSCSPVTEQQIRKALSIGFDGIALDPAALLSEPAKAIPEAVSNGLHSLTAGRSVVLYTALGPDGIVDRLSGREGVAASNEQLGRTLGSILRELVLRGNLRRVMACGGDTSAHVAGELEIQGLTMVRRIAPGAPLCRAWSAESPFDGLEIALKGGQLGGSDYFACVRAGRSAAT